MARINEIQSAPPSPSGRSRARFQPVSTSFDDLDVPRTESTLEPIFCCSACSDTSKDDSFQNFEELLSDGPPFKGSLRSIGSSCHHVITLMPTTKDAGPNTNKKPTRYFAFNESVGEYQEIDSILYTYLLDTTDFEDATSKARFTCPIHRQTYQLTRQDRRQIVPEQSTESDLIEVLTEDAKVGVDSRPLSEVKGSSRPPLSPRQISLEKRRFLVKKLRYGRKDQMQEIVQDILCQNVPKHQQRLGWYLNSNAAPEGEDEKKYENEAAKQAIEKMRELKRIDFEVKYLLGFMRMCFLFGKRLEYV